MLDRRIGYGVGEHVIFGDGATTDDDAGADELAVTLDDDELARRVLARFSSPSYQPPLLPAVALDLQRLSQRSEFDPHAVVALLERDAMLAGKVLARAQSAAFAGANGGPLGLFDAVVRLGMRNLRDVVWEAALQLKVFRAPKFTPQMTALQRHATATAELAAAVAAFSPFPSDYAFLCGLLHDVGVAGMLLFFAELPSTPSPRTMAHLIAEHHAEISQRLVTLWQLPDEIRWVVGGHHQVAIGGFAHPLAAIIAVADDLAAKRGDDFAFDAEHRCDRSTGPTLAIATQALGLDAKKLKLIEEEAKRRARR